MANKTELGDDMQLQKMVSCLASALVLVISILAFTACGSPQEQQKDEVKIASGPIYLPASYTLNNPRTSTSINGSIAYDESGNILSHSYTRVKNTGGTVLGADGSISRYNEGDANTISKSVTLNENGLPIKVVSGEYVCEISPEADEYGRLSHYIKTEPDGGTYDVSLAYSDDGYLEEVVSTYSGSGKPITDHFYEEGWEKDLSRKEYDRTEEGYLGGLNLYYGRTDFVYDENGNVIQAIVDNVPMATIQYIKIDKPSPTAAARANLKLSFDISDLEFCAPILSGTVVSF